MSALSRLGLAALKLAQEYGFCVFPLHDPTPAGCSCGSPHTADPKNAGKHPRLSGGFHGATTHPEQIADWWDRWPNANIGLYPGASQLVVLDVDGPEGEAAARTAGAFSEPTLEVITRRGVHRYFRLPSGVTVGNVKGAELDIRAHAGYVLAPPSVHPSGHVYEWRGALDTIADVPPGVLAIIMAPERVSVTRQARSAAVPRVGVPVTALDPFTQRRIIAYTDRVGYGLADGRKTTAYQLACAYRYDIGISDELTWRCLTLWNAGNAPPLADDVLYRQFTSALRYAQGAA